MAGHCDNVHLYFLFLPPNSFAIFMELHVFFFYSCIKIFQRKKNKEKEEKTNGNRLVASRFFMESAIVWRAIG